MSGTYQVSMGDRGRLVIPAELRSRAGLTEGTALVLLETPGGVVMMSREQLKARVRSELAGLDLVGERRRSRSHRRLRQNDLRRRLSANR